MKEKNERSFIRGLLGELSFFGSGITHISRHVVLHCICIRLISFRNRDKPLRKTMQPPEGDLVGGNANILEILFLRGMMTCINDTYQKHGKQTVTFLY